MFTPGRYVAIDDNLDELRMLVESLHELGAPCVGHHYRAERPVPPELLRGIRILFLDLHLIGGVQGGEKQAFEVIRDILEQGINPDSGPYVIVLWTSHAEKADAFQKHLIDHLDTMKLPLAVLSLDKKNYLGGGRKGAEALRDDVAKAIATDPRLQALLSWERDVLAAAGATLAAVGGLIGPDHRNPADYGQKLDQVLSVLARAAAGKDHAAANIRAAVNAALAPLLSDRILNRGPDPEADEIWKAAVTHVADAEALEVDQSARLNSMLHLALPPAETVGPTDWGAILVLPEDELADERMLARFALTISQLKLSSCPARKKSDRKNCKAALLRLGASCDYAQNKTGPIAYAFCLLVPSAVELRGPHSLSKALLSTPLMDIPGLGSARLFVDARYQITLVPSQVGHLDAVGRVREQLLMQIAAHCAEYSMRPGIVSIEPALIEQDEPVEDSAQMSVAAEESAAPARQEKH